MPKSDRLPKTVFRCFCVFSLRNTFAYIGKHIVVKRVYEWIIYKIKKLPVFVSNLYDSALLYLHVNPKIIKIYYWSCDVIFVAISASHSQISLDKDIFNVSENFELKDI